MTTNRTFIPVKGSEAPISFIVVIDEREYIWTLLFNEDHDFYTIEIKDDAGTILYTSKVILENDLLHAGKVLELTSAVIPRDAQTGLTLRVGENDLGNPVKLYVEAA